MDRRLTCAHGMAGPDRARSPLPITGSVRPVAGGTIARDNPRGTNEERAMATSRLRAAIAAALVLLAGAPSALADDSPETVAGAPPAQWLVELAGAPAADGTAPAALDADQARFRTEARAAGVRYRPRFTYRTLFNGVSLSATDAAAGRLADLDSVAAVYPVEAIPLDVRTDAFTADLAYALKMTGADVAQSRLG